MYMHITFWLFLTTVTVTALGLYAVTHSTYYGKVLQGSIVSRHLMLSGNMAENSTRILGSIQSGQQMSPDMHLLGTSECSSFQTYWTTDGSFYCELLNTKLCHACSTLVNQGPGQLKANVREIKLGDQVRPTFPCIEYPDWKVKGNCSKCNRTGYYGRNCSLRSSCASYHYDPGAVQRHPTNDTPVSKLIAPCFTKGETISVSCRAQFTRWFLLSTSLSERTWWNFRESFSHADFITRLPDEIKLASERLGSRGLTAVMQHADKFVMFSNFSLGPDGSLNLGQYLDSVPVTGLNVPFKNAPLLQGYNKTCGPMWLVDHSIAHNETHIESCASPTNFLALH